MREYNHKIYGYPIKRIPANLHFNNLSLSYSYALFKTLIVDNPDVIMTPRYYISKDYPDMFDLISFFCKIIKKPLITFYAGNNLGYLTDKRYRFRRLRKFIGRTLIKKAALQMTNKIICETESEIKYLINKMGVDHNKIIDLKNPVELSKFFDVPKIEAAKQLNKDPSKKYILHVSTLSTDKGAQHIIHILPKLIKKYEKIELLITGTMRYKKYLKLLVNRMNLESHVSFLGRPDDLNLYYNLADSFCLPSNHSEGTPNVFLEALACNTPSVGTNIGGIPDILSQNIGIIIPQRDEEALYNALIKILDRKHIVDQTRREKLLSRLSMDFFSDNLEKVFLESQ